MKTFLQGPLALPVSTVAPNQVTVETDLSSLNGAAPIWMQISGTFSASYVPEISLDGNVWFDASKLLFDATTGNAMTSPATAGALLFSKQSLPRFRWRCTGYVNGTPTVQYWGQDSRSV